MRLHSLSKDLDGRHARSNEGAAGKRVESPYTSKVAAGEKVAHPHLHAVLAVQRHHRSGGVDPARLRAMSRAGRMSTPGTAIAIRDEVGAR